MHRVCAEARQFRWESVFLYTSLQVAGRTFCAGRLPERMDGREAAGSQQTDCFMHILASPSIA